MLKFTEDHEWLNIDGNIATVGITRHAAEQLGDLVFVELPKIGATLTKGSTAAVVESVKAASDVYAPLDGEVIEVNPLASADPSAVNGDPQGAGWLYKVRVRDLAETASLMDEEAYAAFTR